MFDKRTISQLSDGAMAFTQQGATDNKIVYTGKSNYFPTCHLDTEFKEMNKRKTEKSLDLFLKEKLHEAG